MKGLVEDLRKLFFSFERCTADCKQSALRMALFMTGTAALGSKIRKPISFIGDLGDRQFECFGSRSSTCIAWDMRFARL